MVKYLEENTSSDNTKMYFNVILLFDNPELEIRTLASEYFKKADEEIYNIKNNHL